jgi:hypothetical protein
VAVEATHAVGDADLGAKDESCALIEYGVGEAEMPSSSPVDARSTPLPGMPTVGVLPPRPPRDTPEVVSL